MIALQLINYLLTNLKFGCIKHCLLSEDVVNERLELTIKLLPFKSFFQNDQDYIRCHVLESMEVRNMPNFDLKYLYLGSDYIYAVYCFHKVN